MSSLRPKGVPVMIDGVERHFLFTLNVVDEIQEHYDMALPDVLGKFIEENRNEKIMIYLVAELLRDEAERESYAGNNDLKIYSLKETGWILNIENRGTIATAIFEAYGVSLPEMEDEEVEDPNMESGQTGK